MRLIDALSRAVADLIAHLKIAQWRWERDGIGGAVDQATVKLIDGAEGLRAEFHFVENGAARILTAERRFASKTAQVSLDGADVPGGTMALSKHLHLWPPALIVEVDIDAPSASLGAASVYKFTGHVS